MSSMVTKLQLSSWKAKSARPRAGSLELTPQVYGPLDQAVLAPTPSSAVAPETLGSESYPSRSPSTASTNHSLDEEDLRLRCKVSLNRFKIGPWAVTSFEIAQVLNIWEAQLYRSPHFLDRLAWLAEKQPVWRDVAKRMALVARSALAIWRETSNVITPPEEALIEVVNILSQHAERKMSDLQTMFPVPETPQKRERDDDMGASQIKRSNKRTKLAPRPLDVVIPVGNNVTESPTRQYSQDADRRAAHEGQSERASASSEPDDRSKIQQPRRRSKRIITPVKNAQTTETRHSFGLRSLKKKETTQNQGIAGEDLEWHSFNQNPNGPKWAWDLPPNPRGRSSRKTISQQEPTPPPSVDISFTELTSSVSASAFERNRAFSTLSAPIFPMHLQSPHGDHPPATHGLLNSSDHANAPVEPSRPTTSFSSFSGNDLEKDAGNDNASDGYHSPNVESDQVLKAVSMKEFLGLSAVDLSSIYERCYSEVQVLMDEVKMSMPVATNNKSTIWQTFSRNSVEMMQILLQSPFTSDNLEKKVQENPCLLSESTLERLREEVIKPPMTSGYKLHRLHYYQVIVDFAKELTKDRRKSMVRWSRAVEDLQRLMRETIQPAIESLEQCRLNTSTRIEERRAERGKLMRGPGFKPDLREEAKFTISRYDSIDLFTALLKDGFSAQIEHLLKSLKEDMTDLGDNARGRFQETFVEAIERHF